MIPVMESDSRADTLSFADALLTWSDPLLIRAIAQAEAEVTPGELRRRGRPVLERLTTELRPPQSFRPIVLSPAVRRVDDAWDDLFAAWRLKIERELVVLTGVDDLPAGEPKRAELPSARAAEFIFDASAGAVFVGGRVYLGVQVRRVSAPVAHDQAAPSAVPRPEVLPLRDALAAWSDPEAVSRYKRLEWLNFSVNNVLVLPTPYLRTASDPEPARESFERYELEVPSIALSMAWSSLEQDFRARIEGGELRPRGVQVYPLAKADREVIPHLWAVDFHFDFSAGRIHVVRHGATTHSFVAVQIVRDQTVAKRSSVELCAPVTDGQRETTSGSGGPTGRSRRNGGRRSDMPVIHAALVDYWDELYPKGPPADPPQWIALGRSLCRRMERARRTSHGRVPALETVRKHLPEIYVRVLVEKGAARSIDQ
jgi:hypothetical protein